MHLLNLATGTKAFPHPMAGIEYVQGRARNYQSYSVFETLVWTSFSREINLWRFRTLKVPHIYAYASSLNPVSSCRVPFSAMWSPSFVPKPEDWPEQCEVVGTFVVDQKKGFDVTPFSSLQNWLDNGPKPIFIGFGSMVIKDPAKLEVIISEAAQITNRRVIVQSSWTKLSVSGELVRSVGPCPHDWLLPQCSAVVHHGGAGTTAAGLRFGLPTLVCPFFADQFMWGFFVEMAGVGPKACPINKLTARILADKMEELGSPEMQQAAHELGEEMKTEDGIEGGMHHFLDSLDRDNMLCDVSLLLFETKHARFDLIGTGLSYHGIKVSSEVAAVLEMENKIDWNLRSWLPSFNKLSARYWYAADIRRHPVVSYDLSGHVETIHHGFFAAIAGIAFGSIEAVMQLYFVSDRYARSSGTFGCLFGTVMSAFYVVWYLFIAVAIFFDRLLVGIANGLFGKDYDYLIDPSWKARVHRTKVVESEVEAFKTKGVPRARKKEIIKALEVVVRARILFQSLRPHYPRGHRNFYVVRLTDLMTKLKTPEMMRRMKFTENELRVVHSKLEQLAAAPPPVVRRATRFPAIKKMKNNLVNQLSSIRDDSKSDLLETDESDAVTSPPTSSMNVETTKGQIETDTSGNDMEITEVHDENGSKKKVVFHERQSAGTSSSGGRTFRSKLLSSMSPESWRRRPEDYEVSFSMFLFALRQICGAKCMENTMSSRASVVVHHSSRHAPFDDYSAYLN